MPIRFALTALAFALGTAAHGATFTGTYFFGDSLSDSGAFAGIVPVGGKFTTNPGQVWTELLASHYGQAATPINSVNPFLAAGGTNYSMGGAQVNTTPGYGQTPTTLAASIHQQVDLFLTGHPTADSTALYSLWGGANDIFYQVNFAGTLKAAATAASLGDFTTAQGAAALAVQQATATNGPSGPAMTAVANAAASAAGANNAAGVVAAANQAAGVTQTYVVQAANDMVAEIARLKAAGARYIVVPNLPDMGSIPGANVGADAAAQAQTRATFSSLSSLYNTTLAYGLKQAGLDVIAVNINGIMKEIIANPTPYGLTNTTGMACNTSSSLICTPSDLADPQAPETWFFADGAHPTTAVHRMIAQYTESVIEAPQQIAQLPQVNLQLARQQRATLADRLQVLRQVAPARLQLYVDARHAETEQTGTDGTAGVDGAVHMLGVGGERAIGDKGWLGFAVHFSSGTHDFGNQRGSFDLNESAFTLYGGWREGGLYGQVYTQLGMADYNDVTRRVDIGTATRLEVGDARGHRVGMGADIGYDMTLGPVRTGPVAGVHRQTLFVGAFHEKAADSTAMSYGSQKVSSLQGSLGWSVTLAEPACAWRLQPYASLTWQGEFDNDAREIRGGLTSLGSTFVMPVAGHDDQWLDWRVGTSAMLGNWQALFSVNGSSGMEQGSDLGVALNLSTRF